jgi:putative flippase GtrA
VNGSLAARLATSRFAKFAVVGGVGFLVNEAALWMALTLLRFNPYLAGIFSFLVAATFTWWGNRLLTFRERAARGPRSIAAEWITFVAVNGIGFLVNYAIYASLITFAAPPLNSPFVALAFGTLAGLLLNFALSSQLVFRAPPAS